MGATGGLRVDVLGPLRVTAPGGHDLTPAGTLQRRLLALLVLHRGHVVSVDTAADALWPDQLPADPAAAVQNHMFRLRRLMPGGIIASVGDGYWLAADTVDVDADRLAAAVSEPAVSDAPGSEVDGDLERVLDRWRGPAYLDLADHEDAVAEAARLEELRLRAVELRAARRLAAGDTAGLAAELQALADAHPVRERPHALLVEALAASGRVAEALRAYDDFRRRLGAELGIDPSPEFAARHAELLTGVVAPSAWAPSTRLVHPPNELVGRDQLLAEVLARASATRLVTLVGPGGVGKTRLLIELGHALTRERPDRPVVLCELATGDAASAVDVVAAALGVDARPGVALADRIVDVVGTTELVLLLDNCEHVLEPVAALAEQILGRCGNARLVATSRERLRVAGEHVHVVPTLALGDDAPAVQLFVERGRAVAPGFEPDAAQRERVAEIVARLDGLPLAIELAAARLHTHDLDEVAAGLDDRFTLLTAGQRASTRHGSLGAAVAWSYGLLDPELQERFADLSAFAGDFTAAGAAAVAGTSVDAAARDLAELVERSLVMRAPGRRYVLLETLRAFGAEQIRSTGRSARVARRHAEFVSGWLAEAAHRMFEPGNDVIGEIEHALPELRSAFGWALDHGQTALTGQICAALFEFGFFRLRPDVLAWAERALAAAGGDEHPLAVDLWVSASYAAWMAGDVEECGVRSRRALALAERTGGSVPARVLTAEGSYWLFQGELDTAADYYHRSAEAEDDPGRSIVGAASELLARGYAGQVDVAAELGERLLHEVPDDTCHAAYVWYCAGESVLGVDVELARRRLVRAIELAERTRASFVVGVAGASKASLEARHGDPLDAAAEYRRLLVHWQRAGMWSTQWTMLRSVAALLARLGRHREAAELEGAIRATLAGHRIFGADEVALEALSATLRSELGDAVYSSALRTGAMLDGHAAVELALRAL